MELVAREDLQIGKLYYIQGVASDDLGNRIPYTTFPIMVGIFKGLKTIYPFVVESWHAAKFDWFEAPKLKNIKDEREVNSHVIREVELNYMWNFYEVKRFKIQNDMEARAVNSYLREIIGDPYFTYT